MLSTCKRLITWCIHPCIEEFLRPFDAGFESQLANRSDDQLPQRDVHERVVLTIDEAQTSVDGHQLPDDVLFVIAESGSSTQHLFDILG